MPVHVVRRADPTRRAASATGQCTRDCEPLVRGVSTPRHAVGTRVDDSSAKCAGSAMLQLVP
jgi:hypothetical protein